MCGSESELFRCRLEGSILHVCRSCSKHGEVLGKVQTTPKVEKATKTKPVEEEILEIIDKNYSSIIKTAREQLGLKQKDFAQQIAEKESLIHSLESGHMEPNFNLARKLERTLNITLVKTFKNDFKAEKSSDDESLTIGDLIKKGT